MRVLRKRVFIKDEQGMTVPVQGQVMIPDEVVMVERRHLERMIQDIAKDAVAVYLAASRTAKSQVDVTTRLQRDLIAKGLAKLKHIADHL